MKQDLLSLRLGELEDEVALLGWPLYRGKQIFRWLSLGEKDFRNMTNLSNDHQRILQDKYDITSLKVMKKQLSKQDGTAKYLLQLLDGELIESVLMKYKHGNSVCISTQVGCGMGCDFCASGQEGLLRNLTPGEMVDQILTLQSAENVRISHVVLMGSGEPLQNLPNVVKLMRIINEKEGLCISLRNVTVSTCGLIPEIYRLASYKFPINLAISLHASDDETRRKIMPVAGQYKIRELVNACDEYAQVTGRRITYEYALMKGVNDAREDMGRLAKLLKGKLCHVNLILVNPVEGKNYRASERDHLELLRKVLSRSGIAVTVRRELGSDIDAACGQLKRRTMDGIPE